ncbi:MAG TPA: hypothetical protein VK471_09525 [Solirubrobacterales bacterium]|nr:hypothetical protein [Solirubrobacterales bacterium]
MSRWSDAGAWVGDGLRREVFFFRSGRVDLYGSLYAAAEPSLPIGLVACGSWGIEADRTEPLMRSVALATARLGGAAFVFHYPGYGDSYGGLADLTLVDLGGAAADAVAEASRRYPDLAWSLAGYMFGASVACLALQYSAARLLLLVQPALRPSAYFARLTENRRSLAPGSGLVNETIEAGTAPGMAYGYPVPRHIVEHGEEADAAVAAALAAFPGEGAIVRHQRPVETDAGPPGFEQVEVAGAWRFGSQNNPKLAAATAEWLDRRTRVADR